MCGVEVVGEPGCRLAPPIRGGHPVARDARRSRLCGAAELRGHAAPVDTGSTAQRYAVPFGRVKPNRVRTATVGTCGQPLDPQVARLVSVRSSRDSPRSTATSLACRRLALRRSEIRPLTWAFPGPGADLRPSSDAGHPAGQHAQPVDKRVDRPRDGQRVDQATRPRRVGPPLDERRRRPADDAIGVGSPT